MIDKFLLKLSLFFKSLSNHSQSKKILKLYLQSELCHVT